MHLQPTHGAPTSVLHVRLPETYVAQHMQSITCIQHTLVPAGLATKPDTPNFATKTKPNESQHTYHRMDANLGRKSRTPRQKNNTHTHSTRQQTCLRTISHEPPVRKRPSPRWITNATTHHVRTTNWQLIGAPSCEHVRNHLAQSSQFIAHVVPQRLVVVTFLPQVSGANADD